MLEIRPFFNTDPPGLAEVWRAQPPQRALFPSITHTVLERYVFCKPYFDRLGLLVALHDKELAGFVHAGFAATEDRQGLNPSEGVISLLMVAPHSERDAIGAELLQEAEAYLRHSGASHANFGGGPGADPFYVGLIGGSQISGVSPADAWLSSLVERSGYLPARTSVVFQKQLVGFRPKVDREQMQMRRKFRIQASLDPQASDWWDACVFGEANRSQFALTLPGGENKGRIVVWDIEPLAHSWGVHANGILELNCEDEWPAAPQFLLAEMLRQLQSQGVGLVEAHCATDDTRRRTVYENLEFEVVDEPVSWEKQL